MNKEEIIYKMACDFGHEHYSEIGEIDYKLYEDTQGKDIAAYFAEKLAARDEEIQKQIEAVRGLTVIQNLLPLAISGLQGETKEQLQLLSEQLTRETRTLTETLKPHLSGEKFKS